jgi:hypothetical protein
MSCCSLLRGLLLQGLEPAQHIELLDGLQALLEQGIRRGYFRTGPATV